MINYILLFILVEVDASPSVPSAASKAAFQVAMIEDQSPCQNQLEWNTLKKKCNIRCRKLWCLKVFAIHVLFTKIASSYLRVAVVKTSAVIIVSVYWSVDKFLFSI